MSKANEKEATRIKEPSALRVFLIRAILGFSCIVLVGLIVGGVLISRIGKLSGWGSNGQVQIYSQAQIDKFITSVLIAVQNQPLSQEGAPADMVFIAAFNAFEQELTVVAMSPKTMVEVEGYGQKPLGEAYALGGPGLLVNTVNQNFDLDLQNYACTDTHSLAAMIDLLGGIKTRLTRGEADYINNALNENVKAGQASLSGTQSMVHAMDAISGSAPFGDVNRSLELIHSAIFGMRKTATKEAMLPLLSLVFSNINTNLDFATLNDLGYEILKAEQMEYSSLLLPSSGTWEAAGENGEEIHADIPKNAALLQETLYNAN